MHYALSRRSDTEYWKHVTNNVSYDKSGIFERFEIKHQTALPLHFRTVRKLVG